MDGGRARAGAKRPPQMGRAEFQLAYRTGRRHGTPVATVYVLPGKSSELRVAIPVGRRVGTAVARNRVRRRLRAAFQRVRQEAVSGGDIIIVARSAAASAPFASLVDTIRHALRHAGLVHPQTGDSGPTRRIDRVPGTVD